MADAQVVLGTLDPERQRLYTSRSPAGWSK